MRVIQKDSHGEVIDQSSLQEEKHEFRKFEENGTSELAQRVERTYYMMHEKQTVDFVKSQHEKWCKFNHFEMTIMEALDLLNGFVDESDPDADFPNSFHAFQTAESVRAKYPDDDWFHLVGLIHDLGKVMGMVGQEQWCTVGDTYPVGMAPRESIAFGVKSFEKCPDMQNPKYNTVLGMYQEGCGLDNVLISWGHDEYMYQVLKNHPGCTLPKQGLWCVRYHSFYPWHSSHDYMDLCNEEDKEILRWVNDFNQFDLYSKTDDMPDVEALKPYYQSLIDKYIPGKIKF